MVIRGHKTALHTFLIWVRFCRFFVFKRVNTSKQSFWRFVVIKKETFIQSGWKFPLKFSEFRRNIQNHIYFSVLLKSQAKKRKWCVFHSFLPSHGHWLQGTRKDGVFFFWSIARLSDDNLVRVDKNGSHLKSSSAKEISGFKEYFQEGESERRNEDKSMTFSTTTFNQPARR